MIRLRIVHNYKDFKAGETVELSRNEAFGLIDRGVAVVSKDMVIDDHRVKVDKIVNKVKKKHQKPVKAKDN